LGERSRDRDGGALAVLRGFGGVGWGSGSNDRRQIGVRD
jgi:hypothetical protein